MPSHTTPDWTREAVERGAYEPGKKLLAAIRLYQKWAHRGILGRAQQKRAVLLHRFWSAVCASDIPLETEIEGGLILPHPLGIVIHPASRIGPNCVIFQGVTLGATKGKDGLPVIEGGVVIGAGAKILGAVRVGHHARVGANAVVTKDVPPLGIAVGVPARSVVRASPL
ncbi:MAG: serine acetyltransferase [Deltaproteobacteria bacterium]|nr:serine acetyltransferase [Deltaproteobacteria bacterium]